MSLLSENRTLDFKISDKAIELSVLWVGEGEMEGKTPDLRLRDFEISQYIYETQISFKIIVTLELKKKILSLIKVSPGRENTS